VGIFGSALVVLLTIGFGAAFVPALGATRANPSLSRSLC
jgi:hypothetical protein